MRSRDKRSTDKRGQSYMSPLGEGKRDRRDRQDRSTLQDQKGKKRS